MRRDEEDEYEESEEEDSEESDEDSEEGFSGARYAAVDQIMRGEAAGSSADRAGLRLVRSVTWPTGFGRSALRRSSEPHRQKSVAFAEDLVEMKEYGAFDASPSSSDRSLEMDAEALAPADGAAFSFSSIPTEMESPEEVRDETDALTWGEEDFERVEPIQESENQRLPELHESVAGMAETGTDVSWEGGQAKAKVVHTVVVGPGPLNQEAATSSASGYSGHAFPSGLPGKAVPALAPLSEVFQASDALEEATGADGVGPAEVDEQSRCLPEHAVDEASVLNFLDAKEDGKEEEKDEKDGEKEEDEEDVQSGDSPAGRQPTLLEEVVKKPCSKEEMAEKMERQKLEGLLPQEPPQDGFSKLLQEWLEGANAFLATLGCCGTRQREVL